MDSCARIRWGALRAAAPARLAAPAAFKTSRRVSFDCGVCIWLSSPLYAGARRLSAGRVLYPQIGLGYRRVSLPPARSRPGALAHCQLGAQESMDRLRFTSFRL